MDWLALPAFIFGSLALFVTLQWAINAHRRRWRAFAQQHGGTHVQAKGLFGSARDYVSLTIEGYEVRMDRCLIRYGLNRARCQRVTIIAPSPPIFNAQIYKRASLISAFIKPLGQELQTGQAQLDQAFVVQSAQPQALLSHLDPEAVREQLRQSHLHLKLEHGQLTLVRLNHTYNHEALFAHMNLAALYARGFFGSSPSTPLIS